MKHWLRQAGRTPADLGQALELPAASLPRLLNELVRTPRRNRVRPAWRSASAGSTTGGSAQGTWNLIRMGGTKLDLLLEAIRSETIQDCPAVRPNSSRPMSPQGMAGAVEVQHHGAAVGSQQVTDHPQACRGAGEIPQAVGHHHPVGGARGQRQQRPHG